MLSLVESALRSIEGDHLDDGIALAASFFELSTGRRRGLDRPEVLDDPASPDDVARLRDRLVALVRSGAPDPVAAAAVFAFGKLFDPGLGSFFAEVLRTYLDRDAEVLYQAMIALDNLGVGVFGGRDSMSIAEADENRALAAGFLREPGNDPRT